MPLASVAQVGSQVLNSLMEAHALGIVHRDIKPENVFLAEFAGAADFVKVLDFGIAKAAAREGEGKITSPGQAIGTPNYMAPEQVLGEQVDARTDLYAVGLMLAEMLTGQRVYEHPATMQIFLAQASPDPPPLSAAVLGSAIGPVIERATRKVPDERYASAAAMAAALEQARAMVYASTAQVPVVTAHGHATTAHLPMAPTAGAVLPEPAWPTAGDASPYATTAHVPTTAAAGAAPPAPPVARGAGGRTSRRTVAVLALVAGLSIGLLLVVGGLFAFGVVGGSSPGERASTRNAELDLDIPSALRSFSIKGHDIVGYVRALRAAGFKRQGVSPGGQAYPSFVYTAAKGERTVFLHFERHPSVEAAAKRAEMYGLSPTGAVRHEDAWLLFVNYDYSAERSERLLVQLLGEVGGPDNPLRAPPPPGSLAEFRIRGSAAKQWIDAADAEGWTVTAGSDAEGAGVVTQPYDLYRAGRRALLVLYLFDSAENAKASATQPSEGRPPGVFDYDGRSVVYVEDGAQPERLMKKLKRRVFAK
jgi:hypothetical protein